MDPDDVPPKPPAQYLDHRGATRVVKRTPEEMRAHLVKVLSEVFGKVESVEEASAIARLKIQLTGGGNDD